MTSKTHEGGLGLERIVFLSDGVFAIAMTILVLEVRLPELPAGASNDELLAAIVGLGPRLFAYALSFSILSLYWIAHWRRFGQIERADGMLATLNLLLLALIALIPFPTGLVGIAAGSPAAVVLYAVTLAGAGLAVVTWSIRAHSAHAPRFGVRVRRGWRSAAGGVDASPGGPVR